VPLGTDRRTVLHHDLATGEAGQRLADTYNGLQWQEHRALGAEALVATGRLGTFILQPGTP